MTTLLRKQSLSVLNNYETKEEKGETSNEFGLENGHVVRTNKVGAFFKSVKERKFLATDDFKDWMLRLWSVQLSSIFACMFSNFKDDFMWFAYIGKNVEHAFLVFLLDDYNQFDVL